MRRFTALLVTVALLTAPRNPFSRVRPSVAARGTNCLA